MKPPAAGAKYVMQNAAYKAISCGKSALKIVENIAVNAKFFEVNK